MLTESAKDKIAITVCGFIVVVMVITILTAIIFFVWKAFWWAVLLVTIGLILSLIGWSFNRIDKHTIK